MGLRPLTVVAPVDALTEVWAVVGGAASLGFNPVLGGGARVGAGGPLLLRVPPLSDVSVLDVSF